MDADGNAVVTGHFGGQITFGTGDEQITLASEGFDDVFVARYTSEGVLDWAVSAGGSDTDRGEGVAVDADGNVFVTGTFRGQATFGAGDQQTTLISAGDFDVLLARYDPDGVLDWVVSAGRTDIDSGQAVDVDIDGNAVVTGNFANRARFGGPPNRTWILISAGGEFDVFVARYYPDGSQS